MGRHRKNPVVALICKPMQEAMIANVVERHTHTQSSSTGPAGQSQKHQTGETRTKTEQRGLRNTSIPNTIVSFFPSPSIIDVVCHARTVLLLGTRVLLLRIRLRWLASQAFLVRALELLCITARTRDGPSAGGTAENDSLLTTPPIAPVVSARQREGESCIIVVQ